ncbi:MAG: CoA-binding protein [Bauldia sp.]|nr:MAG: CoA-binding protein [Bauldia sp.]
MTAPDDAEIAPTPARHDTYTDRHLRAVLGSVKSIAVVGASANAARPVYLVMKYLLAKGYRIVPVNPGQAGKAILGQPVYARLADVPVPVDMVDIFRRSEFAGAVVDEALALDPKPRVIWMQLGVRDEAAAARAEAAGLTVIMNRCPKIEYGRLCGENSWAGINSGRIGSRKFQPAPGFQHFRLPSND